MNKLDKLDKLTVRAARVADYFLARASDDERGGGITQLKLQKLLYYAQGYSLAILGHRLFVEDIEAWQHGPVVAEVRRKVKDFKNRYIPAPTGFDASKYFTQDEMDLLDEVYSAYHRHSAWKLRDMTHAEPPYQATATDEVIAITAIRNYFASSTSPEAVKIRNNCQYLRELRQSLEHYHAGNVKEHERANREED